MIISRPCIARSSGKDETGAKKLCTITAQGRAHLDENRDFVTAVLDRLAAVGRRITRMRRRLGEDERGALPPLVKAALDNLREAASKRLEGDAEAEAKIVDILARAADDVRRN